jgi:hypothetical protein
MNLDIIRIAPAQLVTPERLLLYALVYGLRPKHCLEIGTAQWVERYLPEGTRRRSWYNQVMRAFKNIF